MFSSLRSRLWLSYALLILAALGLLMIAVAVYLVRSPLLYRQTSARLEAVQSVLLARQDELAGLSNADVEKNLARADENFDVRLILFERGTGILFDTRADERTLAAPRLSVLRANQSWRDQEGQVWLYTSTLLENGQRLFVATPRPSISVWAALRDELFPSFWSAGALALVFALFLAFLVARWIADPLQGMLSAAREMPAPVTEIPPRGPQEVRELTQAFNEMVTRVQATQQSQRDFVANISHELKTPLTSIRGFAQALLEGAAETPEVREQAAQVIYDEAGRMHRMALDLLDLARFDSGIAELSLEKLDLAALLRNLEEKFSLQAREKDVELKFGIQNLPIIIGDGDRLAQVFDNLLDNALKHTAAGGTVTINAEETQQGVHIKALDTGAGIPADVLPHIFERFYQVDSSRQAQGKSGSGLGLAIVKEIVLAHGGKISVRSKVGKGTHFDIVLPTAQPDATTLIRKRNT